LERWWNARQPGQRTWVGSRERCEPPVEDGSHVACGSKIASAGGCQHVAEWVLTSFGRNVEQMCPQSWPGGFGGESGDVVVGLVELCDGLWSNALFGRDVETVGVALDGLVEPGRWVVQARPAKVLAEKGASSRAMICCSVSVGMRGAMASGRMRVWESPSPTTWR
jgi:hypothetical protein